MAWWEPSLPFGRKRVTSTQRGRLNDAQDLANANSLRQEVLDSSGLIDSLTRTEILNILDPGYKGQGRISNSGIVAAQTIFNKAKGATEPLYQSRKFIEEKIKLMTARPGRDQVVLSRRTPVENAANNILLTGVQTGR